MKRLTSLGNGLKGLSAFSASLMLAASFGAAACNEDEVFEESGVDPELGVNFDELGTPITNCTAATTTEFNATTKVLAVTVPDNVDAVISVVGGKIKFNGNQCQTSASPPVELTSSNVNRINVTASDHAKVVVDLLPGAFGNIFAGTGGIVVTGGANLSVGVRGTAQANLIKMSEASTAYYLELSGDTRADLKIAPTGGAFPPISLALGDGADSFNAQGQGSILTIAALGTGTQGDVGASQPITVFGGAGNDTLKGGLGDDTLNGGDGNDLFLTNATTASVTEDGGDTYVGGSGTDTVDYSGRTTGINVSVGHSFTSGWVKGLNVFNATVASSATLSYTVGTTASTYVFNTAAATVGASAILAELNNLVGATASINDRGELLIVNDTAGALAVAATGAGAALVGTAQSNTGTASAVAAEANDGLAAEADDVRNDIENITGGTGNDTITGGNNPNLINGGAGNDDIAGGVAGTCTGNGADTDTLNGGDGNDLFQMGFALNCSDVLDGGAGTDIANYEMRSAGVSVDIDGAADDGELTENDNVKTTVEGVYGGEGDDTLTGSTAADELHGGIGIDSIFGGTGNDTIVGGPGVDTLIGGAGEDFFNEKLAADAVYVKSATILAGAAGDIINGGADLDKADFARTAAMTVTLCASTNVTGVAQCNGESANDSPDNDDLINIEYFVGGDDADTITGSSADDIIEGGTGADTILGGAGNDTLYGEAGNDQLDGEAGDDTLDGALGTNTLIGGSGDDLCTLGAGGVRDPSCEI